MQSNDLSDSAKDDAITDDEIDLSDLAKDDAITGSTENYVNEQANNVFDLLLKEFSENNTDTTESLKNSLESELEDALSTDADEAMIDDIVNSLKVKGFENIDDLPYETLEILINRAEVFDENGKSIEKFINDVCGKVINDFAKFYKDLKASPAINYIHDDDDVKVFKSYNIDYEGASGLYLKRIRECITSNFMHDVDVCLKTGENFSEEKIEEIIQFVYQRLRNDPTLAERIDNNFDSFIQNVQSTLHNILQVNRRALAQNQTNKLYRDNTSKYLLKDELQMFQDLLPSANNDFSSLNVKFIKQIFTDGDKYYFKCESCGEKVYLDKSIAVNLSFPLNGAAGKRSLVLPKIFRCKCGQKHFFTDIEINLLKETIKPIVKSGINDLTKKLIDMSKGSALLKYEIPINLVKDNWSYCIVATNSNELRKEGKSKSSDELSFSTVSDIEFEQAVKSFYTLLNTFNPNVIPKVISKYDAEEKETDILDSEKLDDISFNFNQNDLFGQDDDFFSQVDSFFADSSNDLDDLGANQSISGEADVINDDNNDSIVAKYEEIGNLDDRSDLLTYKEIAVYFCKILSIDYPVVKNKALFSLIFSINNNKVLNEYLNCSNIYEFKSILKFIDSSAILLEKNVLPDDQQVVELEYIANYYGEVNTLAKLESLKDDKPAYCQELLSVLESEKVLIKDELKKYENERKKIILELNDVIESLAFTQIINISQVKLGDILNIVTDKTIYKLFDLITDRMIITNYAEDFYDRYKTFNILNRNSLKNSLNVRTQAKHITQSVMNTIMNKSDDLGITISEGELYNNFRMVDALTQSNLGILNDLNSAFTNADYYEFCRLVIKVSNLPERLNTLISDKYTDLFYEFINTFLNDAKAVMDAYESPESYYLQDFSQDEITLAKTYKKQLHFNRYMPKRLPDEGIIDYINRYEKMLHNGDLTKYNSVNYGKEFDTYAEYFGLLFSCSALYETTYHSFTTATFVTQFVKTVVASRSNKMQTGKLLGISTPVLNLIDYEIANNESEINFENINLLLKVISGIYITSVKRRVDALYESLYNYVVKNTDALTKSLNYFDVKNWLLQIASDDEVNFTPYKDVPEITDYSDSMSELYTYSEDEELKQYI